MKKSSDIRRYVLLGIIAAAFLVFAGDLVRLQLIHGKEYKAEADAASTRSVSISAARGEIVDRYGVKMVSNYQGCALVFDYNFFPPASEQEARNEEILGLIRLLGETGEEWNDTLPLEFDSDGNIAYMEDRESDIKRIKSQDLLNLNDYATAQNCFDALIERYDLQKYSARDARNIASVCLAMKMAGFNSSTPYTFADDVADSTVARIKENSLLYKGVDVEIVPYRQYSDGTIAPHILGRVAAISAEEYEENKDKGYSINDEIGKSGIEYAMESYLRGIDGKKVTYTDSDGNVTGSEITEPPQQGNTVRLTIDAGLQAVLSESLGRNLYEYTASSGSLVPAAGAAVVLDCNTGEILACASYPNYDISTYSENYSELAENPAAPLWNRALMSTYATGSTMKPSVAIAALEEGLIDTDYTVYCGGHYNYLGQEFKCEQAHMTAYVNVINAIKESCNIFFYEVGKNLGITKMNEYRTLLGFGQKTGCELSEKAGILDSPSYRESLGEEWLPGFTVQSAIGQAGNLITPIQLANYCATIANGGTRYKTHFVKSVLTYDNATEVLSKDAEVACETGISKETLDIVREGMHRVCTSGYCYTYFNHLPRRVDPAAKTGTSQEYRIINGKSTKINNGFLITYAPYENPEIAIALLGEGMTSGVYVAPIAADVYEYYFAKSENMEPAADENTLLV